MMNKSGENYGYPNNYRGEYKDLTMEIIILHDMGFRNCEITDYLQRKRAQEGKSGPYLSTVDYILIRTGFVDEMPVATRPKEKARVERKKRLMVQWRKEVERCYGKKNGRVIDMGGARDRWLSWTPLDQYLEIQRLKNAIHE